MNSAKSEPWFFGSLLVFSGTLLVALDFFTRSVCFRFCALSDSFFSFGLHPFRNYHFVFSLPVPVGLMYVIYFVTILFLLSYVVRRWGNFSWFLRFMWMLAFIGAMANVVDRIVFGYVRDFIQLGSGYLNLADFYILIATFCILVHNYVRAQRDRS